MKAKTRLMLMLLVLLLAFALSSCFEAELPYIGDNGNWFIDGADTGVPANGKDGAKGDKGDTGDKGLDGEKGETGDTLGGDMPTVTSYEKLSESEDGAVYKITFSDGKTAEITVANGKDGADGEVITEVSDIIASSTLIPSSERIFAKTLTANTRLTFPREKHTNASSRRVISAFMKLSDIGEGKIYIGQGKDEVGASYVEITKDRFTVFTRVADADEPYYIDAKHRISSIKDYLFVTIEINMGEANVSFLTSGGFYEKHEAFWSGSAGDVFLEGSGVELTDISFSVGTAGYSENVWIMTDVTPRSSVFENNLFYLNKANYTNNLIIGASGMDSTFALSEFKRALEKGTPQYAVWSVGSTEADAADKMNEKYASNTAEFLSICDTKGIIPILSTQANREGADHSFKNAYVEASGRRYIDLAGKLGAKAAGDTTLSDTFYTGEGEARALDLGAIARAEISELVRVLPEIALKKD